MGNCRGGFETRPYRGRYFRAGTRQCIKRKLLQFMVKLGIEEGDEEITGKNCP
jgi:hypothetical protein